MYDGGYGLGDEELMTVQGFDGHGEYGGLYQAPDGSVYQMQGIGQTPVTQSACVPGEVRQGADGRLYQWVEGYDGLGDPIGFWSVIPAIAKAVLPMATQILPKLFSAGGGGGAGQILQRFLPQVASLLQPAAAPQSPAPQSPAPQSPPSASDELTGVGALYQAPDGSLYQVQGISDDEVLRGYADPEPLSEDEVMRGYDDGEPRSEDELRGVAEGYAPDDGVRGTDGYVRERPARTRAFVRPSRAPDMWRPLW